MPSTTLKNPMPDAPAVVGHPAPDFTLPDARGGEATLSQAHQHGPVVIRFYRGGWCPLCSRQLAQLSQSYESFKNLGATILAISNEPVTRGNALLEKFGPPYALLMDESSDVLKRYGVLAPKRDPLGFMLRKNGYATPSVFIIDTQGTIRWRFVGKNYRDQPSTGSILQALERVNAQTNGTRPASNAPNDPAFS